MKRMISLLASVMLAGSASMALSGCGGSDNGSAAGGQDSSVKKVTIALMASANEDAGWTEMINTANKELEAKKIKIEISKVPAAGWTEYYQKLITQMAGGKAPDIGRIAESFMPQIISKNQALDITDKVNALDMSAYYKSTFEGSLKKGGKIYGVPSGIYHMVMYYNKTMFKEKGIPEPSKDWNNASSLDEVRDMAKKLTFGKGANKVFGLSAGPYISYIGMYSKSNGGDNIFDANGKSSMTSPASLAVYQWFDNMLQADTSMPRPTDTVIMSTTEMFKAGRLGMIVDGTWWLPTMKDIKGFEVGIAAVPSGKGKSYSSQFVDSFFILKNTKQADIAWEALQAIINKNSFDALVKTGVGGMPIQRASTELFVDAIRDKFDANDIDCMTKGLEHTIPVPYNEYYESVDQQANAAMDEWLNGKISYEDYAKKVSKFIDDAQRKANS